MGYCYDQEGKLCCDVCSSSGGVHKHKCPFGWCQPVALCPKCKEEHPEYLTKEFHRKNGCEKNSQEFHQQEKEKADLIAAGRFVRCSALWLPPEDKVKVIFHGQTVDKAYFMTQATYDAIPLMVNATIEDYQAKGTITECRNLDIRDPENKPVEVLDLTTTTKKQALIDYWTNQGIGNSIRPDTWEKIYIDEEYDILERTHKLVKESEPAAVITKEVILAKLTFNGLEVCGRRGRKAPFNQIKLELNI